MNVAEEIQLNQFGQSIYSLDYMLDQFKALDTLQQQHRFGFLYYQLSESTWRDTDIQQALADFSSENAEALYKYFHFHRFINRPSHRTYIPNSANPPNGQLDIAYRVLLTLFKIKYKQNVIVGQDHPTTWQYQDLANPDVVQAVFTNHQKLVERVYADPSYRSEFSCLENYSGTTKCVVKPQARCRM